jgi:glycosyltransferase involved in cell wall biosynthesis
MRVAFVTYPTAGLLPPYHGSMGASIYTIASLLANRCEVTVYGLEQFQQGAKSGTYNGVRYCFFPSTKGDRIRGRLRDAYSRLRPGSSPLSTSNWLYPDFGRQVALHLKQQPCDVVHIQHCSQFVPVIRDYNPAVALLLHLHAQWLSQSNYSAIARRLTGLDLLATVSNYVTNKTRQDFPAIAGRCETIYNGIDIKEEFRRERDYNAASRRKEKRLLYVGGVWPHKGAHIVVEAFNIIVERYPNVRLDFVGPQGIYPLRENIDIKDTALLTSLSRFYEGSAITRVKVRLPVGRGDFDPYMSYLKSHLSSAAADRVTFHGYVGRPELIEHYYKADVFVFPPIWDEAFGCTPVEAMAAGIPVVVSRAGGICETVRDQETGFLVDKNDVQGLVRAILTLLEDDALRQGMGRSARRHAFEQFNWETIVDGMYDRYKALAEKGTTRLV